MAVISPLPERFRHLQLVTIAAADDPYAAGFADLVTSIGDAARSLGLTTACSINQLSDQGMNLLFRAHRLSANSINALPANTVIYNSEQLGSTIFTRFPYYPHALARFPVWDYSLRNIQFCRAQTGNSALYHVRVGFTPGMARITSASEPSIDVLFYGSVNQRRKAVLDRLSQAGLRLRHLFGVYGAQRDAAIADAKVVLNLHYFPESIHEIVRTSLLLANGKAVVTECNHDTEIDDDLRQAMIAVPYDDVVEACVSLVADPQRRRALEQQGFAVFSRRCQAAMLAEAIARTPTPPPV